MKCVREKAKKNILQYLPVPVQHVVKSFEVVTIVVLRFKTHINIQISWKSVVQACYDIEDFDAHLERRTDKFQVSIYSD